MAHWIYENVFILLLAGVSGIDLLKRLSGRLRSSLMNARSKAELSTHQRSRKVILKRRFAHLQRQRLLDDDSHQSSIFERLG